MSKLKLYDARGNQVFQVDVSQEIDRGGEGIILLHPKNKKQVIKIYQDGIAPSLTPASWSYLQALGNRFVKPLELFYSQKGDIAGFSMMMLERNFFRLSQLFSKNECNRLGIQDIVKTTISKGLTEVVKEAHNNGIVLGDFNPFNIFVDANGEIKIIDVDSFETPVQQHTGRLLDEIRDHYYLGAVNQESDYYALAVSVFRMLTYVHPYKGIHKTWKQLEERAIKRISVLSNDNDLTIPAFYEPLTNKELELQFKRIFNDGERFLIQVDQINNVPKRKVMLQTLRSDISVKIMAENVLEVYFNEELGYIKTTGGTEVYKCAFIGNLTLKEKMNNADYDNLIIGNNNSIRIKDNRLYQENKLIVNLELSEDFRFVQLDQIIHGVDGENLYHIYPDKILNQNIAYNKTPAWGRGFKFINSPVQLTGGIARIHYRNGNMINSTKLSVNPKTINMIGNIGFITYLENEKLRNYWCYINSLNLEFSKETDEIYSFAMKQANGVSYVFVPADGKVEILRVPDFEKVDAIDFRECTAQSKIFITHSGLLLLENNVLYLINRN